MFKQTVLGRLPKYNGVATPVVQEQSVYDIMDYMQEADRMFGSEYDLIYDLFIGPTPLATIKNLYRFLRPPNTRYVIETVHDQTVKSPSAILAESITIGIDCKNYALFIGGVLSAINRSGKQSIPFVYRFASYKVEVTDPYHVFIVAYVDGVDYWIDPVLKTFNERLKPFYFIDQKPQDMLSIVSGPNPYSNVLGVDPATAAAIAQAAPKVIDLIKGLFGNRPNPNDWQGWDGLDRKWGLKPGSAPSYWAANDGDSVPNEVSNVLSYIQNVAKGDLSFMANNSYPPVQPEAFRQKLIRGGVGQEQAQQLYYALDAVYHPEKYTSTTSPTLPGTGLNTGVVPKSNNNTLLWVGLAVAVVGGGYLMIKK